MSDNPTRRRKIITRRMPALFVNEHVTLSSGEESTYKIECDVLTSRDWAGLAHIASIRFDLDFGQVFGVAHGGLTFATAMAQYVNPESNGILVVDDVLTTGASIRSVMEMHGTTQGLVAFARGPLPIGVKAIWQLGGQA